MGREGTDMETKALKKQLGAAIAMVVVAAIALGSATYAWFVSNNSVTATTSNVYAQSNSAYLVIDNAAAGKTSSSSTSIATASENVTSDGHSSSIALYPAIWANDFGSNKAAVSADNTAVYQFESAYAESTSSSAMKTGTLFAVGDTKAATDNHYAYLNTFYVGTGGYDGIFENLKVTKFEVSNQTGESTSSLPTAMRALVTCGENWVVVKMGDDNKAVVVSQKDKAGTDDSPFDGIIRSDKFGKNQTTADAQVDVYLFYDGSDTNVHSDNLKNSDLSDCHVTLTFEATPTEYGKTSTGA